MRTIHAAMLAGCLCCALMPAFAKDAGWQWYNEKLKPRDEDRKAVPAAPPPQMDILEKLATLQAATKRSLYEAILYPSSENWHCCKVSDEAAFCLIQRPYISKTLLTRRISPRGSP